MKLEHTIILPSTVTLIAIQQGSDLVAAVCDDMVIRIIDIEMRRIVRELGGFRGRILDIVSSGLPVLHLRTYITKTFSSDSRWLVAASLDSFVRTFDIPTGRLIDSFKTPSVATSISFSPTNDFLATAHVDSVAIYLWYSLLEINLFLADFPMIGQTELNMMMSPCKVQSMKILSKSSSLLCEALKNMTVCN
jgi:U3 small nucleolar RNA-associated protein 21